MVGSHWDFHRFLRTAKYALRNTRGTEIPNHNTSRGNMVVTGTARDDLVLYMRRFSLKKTMNVIPGNKRAVKMIANFHCYLAPLISRSLILGCNISSHGFQDCEDQDDRLQQAATVC